ncbi:hypothetical protein [Paraburkholderia gardini]|uniref:hypothetical protein n=1 Tax=Paraburkholderia gardini TaxID=2823469 RepID=UPI001D88B166|nr:hypothetical protein [Paraburkholderia gardini]CAG4890913.1 hypothetical protein R69919_01067 [Paraburkholderia gardini]
MLLAVLQPEFHWFSDDPSAFIALVEQAVCRAEFDVLVLPTPSIACAREAETDTSTQIASYFMELSRRKHALIGFGIRTYIGREVSCAVHAAYDGRLYTSSVTSSKARMINDWRPCYVATESVRAGVFQDVAPDEGLLLADDHLQMFRLEDAQILMVSASHREARVEADSGPMDLRSSHRLNAYRMVARFAVREGVFSANHDCGGSTIVSPRGQVLVDGGTKPGCYVTEIPDILPFHS